MLYGYHKKEIQTNLARHRAFHSINGEISELPKVYQVYASRCSVQIMGTSTCLQITIQRVGSFLEVASEKLWIAEINLNSGPCILNPPSLLHTPFLMIGDENQWITGNSTEFSSKPMVFQTFCPIVLWLEYASRTWETWIPITTHPEGVWT